MDEMEKTEGFEEQAAGAELEWGLDDTPDGKETVKPEPELYKLRHLGREIDATREEVIALAQKGQDYDRIRDRLVQLESGGTTAAPGGSVMTRNIHDFISAYGDSVNPATIPGEVWTEVRAGQPLVVAYQAYENRLLREQLRGGENRRRASSAAKTAGDGAPAGAIESDWYSD